MSTFNLAFVYLSRLSLGDVHVTLNKSLSLENDTLLSKCCVVFGLEPEKFKLEWLLNGKTSYFNYSTHNFTEGNKARMFCSNLTLSVNRSYHGQSLDCLVQNHRNTSASALLHVLCKSNKSSLQDFPFK
ncbi:hypothetical protein HOLleu_05826 [Holothuria leucospilota]|uniref:Ig-like domain-containing protein n=1 Tax=Holothuria leucospilota TaxID=206669 RepID=A0A9Q1CKM1_HOLLE|nr:hypothetical protein HOLleu_05826 [Holothuria leucospilota]